VSETEALAPEGEVTETAEVGPEDGVAEVEATQPEPEPEPTYDYLDIEDPTSKHVRVKVDGEDTTVTLDEALNSYNRESVSTQRFQQASDMQKSSEDALRMQQAFQANPGLTVQVLAAQQNKTVEEFLGQTGQQQQAAAEPEVEYADPLEKALAEERSARVELENRFEQREADDRLHGAVNGLKQQFNIDNDTAREVVGNALQLGYGPEAFPLVYQAMAYQKSQAGEQAQGIAAQQATDDTAQRQAAARAAAAITSTGTGAAGVTSERPAGERMNLRQSIEAAIGDQF
jgi:hypothetical protein